MNNPNPEVNNKKEGLEAHKKLADYLGRRDHSEKELREKLGRRFAFDVVEQVIQEAKDRGWILKEDVLAEKIAQLLHSKRKSWSYIHQYLKKKGLPAVAKDPTIELQKAHELLELKFHKITNFSFEERQKAYTYLGYRGFDFDTIRKAVDSEAKRRKTNE